jgi:kinesin family protein 13
MCCFYAKLANYLRASKRSVSLNEKYPNYQILRKQPKIFAFDNCFDSINPESIQFADQKAIFESVGVDVLENAFQGYNACILTYGQTSSGKSYTMMGTAKEPGLIPRICDRIFARISEESNDETSFKIEVSYMEIYNEKVHDLLDPKK